MEIVLFSLLYIAVGFVSTYHAIAFFAISNYNWLAVILAIAFEVGQAAVLFSLLTSKSKKVMPWILMGVLTAVQVFGNVFSSYQYMIINNADQIKYFTDSILFFIQDPDPKVNQVMISYITGAILPIVSLCMTSMVVDAAGLDNDKEQSNEIDTTQNTQDVDTELDEKSEEKISKIVY